MDLHMILIANILNICLQKIINRLFPKDVLMNFAFYFFGMVTL